MIKTILSFLFGTPAIEVKKPEAEYWETANGRKLLIKTMDTDHLVCAIRWMERIDTKRRNGTDRLGLVCHPKYVAMQKELKKRGV